MKKMLFLLIAVTPMVASASVRDPRVGSTSLVSGRYGPALVRNHVTGPSVPLSISNMSPSLLEQNTGVNVTPEPTPEPEPEPEPTPVPDDRAAEREACLNNNVGMEGTFVWASRYSDTSSYASMREDLEHPENNICFSRVDIRSTDVAIDVSDLPSKYFPWGDMVTCASWVDEAMLEKRIADAKKGKRALATTAAVVGGIGLGVGVMEGVGNKLIGKLGEGKVMGQLSEKLSDADRLRSKMLELRNKKPDEYKGYLDSLEKLVDACDKIAAKDSNIEYKPQKCEDVESFRKLLEELKKLDSEK
ncbi:MAG: hypothetical protein K5912_02960 [Alphaproteobacteria bacterium]|nr:hypothetical protein [Alphaproteobacteria bacterium]